MKKRISSEYHECLAYFKWAQFNPILREYLIKIVNEGARSKQNGYFLKLIGLRPGLPDYFLPVPNTNWLGLWIEMKVPSIKGAHKKTASQDQWIEKLKKIGHYATYAYGAHEAIQVTIDYLNNKI